MRLAHARTGFVAPVVVLSFAAAAAAPAFAVSGDQIVATARQYLGRPYKFGASMSEAPARMDCSSFTKYVFGRYGIYLLRASYEQINQGAHVNLGAHRAGDLLFFKTSSNGHVTNHVGIYTGDNRIIHTYGSPGVCFSSFAPASSGETTWSRSGACRGSRRPRAEARRTNRRSAPSTRSSTAGRTAGRSTGTRRRRGSTSTSTSTAPRAAAERTSGPSWRTSTVRT